METKLDNFWDNNFYNNPSVTEDDIQLAEKKLGITLPETFKKLIIVQNGGYTKGFVFPMKTKTTWSENHVPLNEMFGIVLDEKFETGHNIMDSDYMISEWGMPEKQVLITGDGHWFITLDYRKGENRTIRWIDNECDEDIHIADSFDEFFNGIVSEDEFVFD